MARCFSARLFYFFTPFNMAHINLRAKLEEILESSKGLRQEVAQYVLEWRDSEEEIECSFTDLSSHGCISGMVSGLIYYSKTHPFFDRHYEEIEEMRTEFEDSTGAPLRITLDLKTFLAWFGFEETARDIALELGIEI